MHAFKPTQAEAQKWDADDPLAAYREQFHLPQTAAGAPYLYLCGHSLGLQPKSAAAYVQQDLRDWATLGVEGHFTAQTPCTALGVTYGDPDLGRRRCAIHFD